MLVETPTVKAFTRTWQLLIVKVACFCVPPVCPATQTPLFVLPNLCIYTLTLLKSSKKDSFTGFCLYMASSPTKENSPAACPGGDVAARLDC